MMHAYFDKLVQGLEHRLAEQAEGPRARKRFALEIARLGRRLFTPGQPVAWCGIMVPYDLLNAMGITSCYVEFVGAMLASTGMVQNMLDQAEQAGFATDSCSYHRSVIGAVEQGLMPEPDFVIATSAPCTGGLAVLEYLARYFDKPVFVLQVPTRDDEQAVEQLAGQLEQLVEFIASHSTARLAPENLRRAVELTNRARAAWVEMNELSARVPTPARPRDLVNFGVVEGLFLGTEAGVEVAECYRDEFAARVAAGQGGHRQERVRLMWLQNRVQFKNPLDDFLAELGAAVVQDELNDVAWEPISTEDPYRGLARRILSIPLCGTAQRRAAKLVDLARRYRVQGAINPCHWGCRQGTGARGIVQDRLRAAGIPVLNLEVDCVDPRHFSEGQLRTRLEAFCEMLAGNRQEATAE